MTKPVVDQAAAFFTADFPDAMSEIPASLPKVIKLLLDKTFEEVATKIENYILENLRDKLKEEVKDVAAEVAESMLCSALAGDNQEIKNLFGFHSWYNQRAYVGKLPTQWALIDAIVARNPGLFESERIKQLETDVQYLKEENARLAKRGLDS